MPKPDKRDFEERYSACFVDFGMKTAAGILIGSMMGSFFLRSYKKWPMYIGGGLGFGMAYSNCENSLNSFLLSMDPKACVIKLELITYLYEIDTEWLFSTVKDSSHCKWFKIRSWDDVWTIKKLNVHC